MNSNVVNRTNVNSTRLRQHNAALYASIGGFSLGASLGWNSNGSAILRGLLSLTAVQIGLVGVAVCFGACLGALLLPFVLKFFTRTGAMIATMPLSAAGWTLICLGEHSIHFVMVGRILCGISGGLLCTLAPVIIGEIADEHNRGVLLMQLHLFVNCGILYAFVGAQLVGESFWRYSLFCSCSCLPILLIFRLNESPLYHLSRNNVDAAKRSLEYYRTPESHQREFEQLQKLNSLAKENNNKARLMFSRKVLPSLISCLAIIATEQLSGVLLIVIYAQSIFNLVGTGEWTAQEQTLLAAVIQLFASILSVPMLALMGRRVLVTLSAALMGTSLVVLGYYFNLREVDPSIDDNALYTWLAPVCTLAILAAYNLGVGPIAKAQLGDSFPVELRLSSAVLLSAVSWSLTLAAMLVFATEATSLGMASAAWLLAGISWTGAIVSALLARDTKGKSLADVQLAFTPTSDDANV